MNIQMKDLSVNRRTFLAAGVSLVVTAGCKSVGGNEAKEKSKDGIQAVKRLIASAPVLQNTAETSIGVSFAVTSDASGWVEYSRDSDFRDATRVYSGSHGLMTVDDKVALVRITGLKPSTKYYYRIGANRIVFEGGYAMRNLGAEVDEKIHSFTTLGASASGSFCVINDTHNSKRALDACFSKIEELKPSVVIWNGDASNVSETIDDAIDIFINAHPAHAEYAADTPYMFLNGNHDFRGRFNRRLEDLMMFREPAERKGEYAELGRNFVQRFGDVCLIGLDTGEDKLDTNPKFAGIFKMKAYREKQAKWLAEAVEADAVRSAKWKVVFCHIPLFDPRPDANPGDLTPADVDPQYKKDYAAWQRTCQRLWGASLVRAGVDIVISGHQHCYRYDPPAADRPWAQLVAGGCDFGVHPTWIDGELVQIPDDARFPTVIEGGVKDGKLVVKVHDLHHQRIAGEYVFRGK